MVEEKRNKALIATQRVQQVIESLILRAPLDGVVSLKENRDAAGGMFFGSSCPSIAKAIRSVRAGRWPT